MKKEHLQNVTILSTDKPIAYLYNDPKRTLRINNIGESKNKHKKNMNAIIEYIIKERKGMYCHAVEVSDAYELECIADAIIQEHENGHDKAVILDFLESLEVYCLDDSNEDSVYNFSFTEYLT